MFPDRSIWRLAAPLRGGRTTERSERSAVRCWAGVAPVWELVWLNRARIAVQSVLFGQSPEMWGQYEIFMFDTYKGDDFERAFRPYHIGTHVSRGSADS